MRRTKEEAEQTRAALLDAALAEFSDKGHAAARLEDIARRILRREPRPQLAEPPPEVQRWAGISPEDFKELEKEQIDEQRSEDSTQ